MPALASRQACAVRIFTDDGLMPKRSPMSQLRIALG
jgi:hypothetical protein